MARTQQQFSTIRTEGALLPPDVLQQIAAGKVEGLRAADYHLPEGYKLNEAITQSWDILKKHWKAFQEARTRLADSDTGTEITNKHWLLPLFRELAYGHLPTQPAPVIDERSYPIERLYNQTPIHLVGCNLPLDRRTKGARGAATASPHSMVQEYLNRSTDHLWAIVSNGRQLRLLRDNVALSRQAFVEFDLEAMMDGEVYPDFALLWLLLHQSRVEAPKADDCWLETWSKLARESGTRILKQLRESVRTAIEALGQGFIAHPRNDALREQLRTGKLSRDDYYRQLLRIVYRLLFLFVAEDRQLLHPPTASEQARDRYRRFYSLSRLRDIAIKLRGSKHGDLWHALSLVFAGLGNPDGCPTLGLVGLGSFLWTPDKTPDLNGPHEAAAGRMPVEIANDDLLTAIRALAYVEQDNVLRSVDYRNLGSEELGSVYESLLELHPDIEIDAQRFTLATAAGNQRKTSGSYYTPDSLVQCLLDSALDPVVEDRLKGRKGDDAQHAILDLTVCDPACGSGHFLIAAAHRLARHLARIRTGETEPSPEDHQTALRDVISRCIYGVDLNPMAVELCKVSLWMEAIEPGKPLSFLDHHIKCGNSLLGVTPRLLHEGIPEAAFTAIEGDDKTVVKELKQRHKKEVKDRTGGLQTYLFEPYLKLGNLAEEFVRVTTDPNDTAADIARKAKLYADLVEGADYRNAKLLADTWCSAFVWKKDATDLGKACPTERDFRECETNPHSPLPHVRDEVARLANEFSFFHWHLAFPEVFIVPTKGQEPENEQPGWNGGFDVILGNPPWEKIHLRDEEFFAERAPEIANAPTKAKRKRLIDALVDDHPTLLVEYQHEVQKHERISAFFRMSGYFPLTGVSRINLYSVFAETALRVVDAHGRFGMALASGILTDDNNKHYFDKLISSDQLVHAWDFENSKAIFPEVHRSYKFALVCGCGRRGRSEQADFAFYLTEVGDLNAVDKHFSLSAEELAILNPNTKACPAFRSRHDASLALHIYRRIPPVDTVKSDTDWPGDIKTPFNSANDSRFFRSLQQLHRDNASLSAEFAATVTGETWLPIYEPKFIHQFSHRFASFSSKGESVTASHGMPAAQLRNPTSFVFPRNWLSSSLLSERFPGKWFLVLRNITGALNERTSIAAIIPRRPCVDANLLVGLHHDTALLVCANLNAFAYDYLARQKIAGTHFNQFIWKQLPLVRPADYVECDMHCGPRFVISRSLELTYTASDLAVFFGSECGMSTSPFRWDDERRYLMRCELDAAYFHMYLGSPSNWGFLASPLRDVLETPREAVDYIMETFPIVKRKDVAKYGSYRTKERILAIYDEMAECIAKGTEWKSPLDPPPGDPRAAWTEEEMEMWRAGRGDELIEQYGLLDDADDLDESDPDQDAEAEDPTDAEAEPVE